MWWCHLGPEGGCNYNIGNGIWVFSIQFPSSLATYFVWADCVRKATDPISWILASSGIPVLMFKQVPPMQRPQEEASAPGPFHCFEHVKY